MRSIIKQLLQAATKRFQAKSHPAVSRLDSGVSGMERAHDSLDLENLLERLASLPAEARQYNLDHLVEHLYQAQDWPRLFELLDTGQFGQAKIQYDPSTRSYAQDLDLGRRAAAWEKWTLEEGLEHLPHLWRYTLLRSSLTSRADNYPVEVFQLLLLLKQEQKAKDLAELLTDPMHKTRVLNTIARYLTTQPGREQDAEQLFVHSHEVALSLENSGDRDTALIWLGRELAQTQNWARAKQVIKDIQADEDRAYVLSALGLALAQAHRFEQSQETWKEAKLLGRESSFALEELGKALARAQQWQEAEAVIASIQIQTSNDVDSKAEALIVLGLELTQAQQWEKAWQMWREAEKLIEMIPYRGGKLLEKLAEAFAQSQQWEETERIIATIEGSEEKARAWLPLGHVLAQMHQLKRAEEIWDEAEKLITEMKSSVKSYELIRLAEAFAKAQQWQRVERVIAKIEEDDKKVWALSTFALALLQAFQEEQATQLLSGIEKIIMNIKGNHEYYRKIEVLRELGVSMVKTKQGDKAQEIWEKIEQIIVEWEENESQSKRYVTPRLPLARSLAQAQQWEQAKNVISDFKDMRLKVEALKELRDELLQRHQADRARAVGEEIKQAIRTFQREEEADFANILIETQQWEEAEQILRRLPKNNRTADDQWRELIRSLAQAQRWEQARVLVASMQDSWEKSAAGAELGIAFIQAQQWDEAEQIIRSIEHLYWVSKAWKEWGKALTLAGLGERAQVAWEEMQREIRFIDDKRDKAEKLLELGQTLVEIQQGEKAQEIWDLAEQTVAAIEYDHERMIMLPELGKALARAQQWERTQRVCDEIEQLAVGEEDTWERDKWWGHLARILVIARRWEETEQVIARTQDINEDEKRKGIEIESEKAFVAGTSMMTFIEENPRTTALTELGVALAQARQWQEAERVIGGIHDSAKKAAALAELGQALIQEHKWQDAERVITSIRDSAKKTNMLTELGQALIQEHKWQEVERIIGNNQSDTNGLAQLRDALGNALVLAGQWEEAERGAADSQDVLKSITDHLANAGEHEHLLRFVQRTWMQVTTRDSAIRLLPLAYGLIPLKPEMGSAFYEAFTWAENFLQA